MLERRRLQGPIPRTSRLMRIHRSFPVIHEDVGSSVNSTFILPQFRHVFASIEACINRAKTLLLTDRFVYNLY
jgi:hypothetical protein